MAAVTLSAVHGCAPTITGIDQHLTCTSQRQSVFEHTTPAILSTPQRHTHTRCTSTHGLSSSLFLLPLDCFRVCICRVLRLCLNRHDRDEEMISLRFGLLQRHHSRRGETHREGSEGSRERSGGEERSRGAADAMLSTESRGRTERGVSGSAQKKPSSAMESERTARRDSTTPDNARKGDTAQSRQRTNSSGRLPDS